MINAPRPRRQSEIFALECWHCARAIELAANAPPYRCSNCSAVLLVEWGGVPGVRSVSQQGKASPQEN